MPEMQLSSVLLPAPFGPISPTIEPDSSAKLTSLSAWMPPKVHRNVFDGEICHLRNLLPRPRIIPHRPCGMNTMTTTSSSPNTRPGASLIPRSSSGTIT